jgi:hypothetical protein
MKSQAVRLCGSAARKHDEFDSHRVVRYKRRMPRNEKADMSVENAFRSLIRDEIESQLRPLQDAVNRLDAFATQLAPLTSFLGGAAPAGPASPVRRGPGRPPKNALAAPAPGTGCGIAGCERPPRSKGYCAAHYQKLRTLSLRNQRPAGWVDFPAPGTVEDVVLPRGRAAAKARKAAKAAK